MPETVFEEAVPALDIQRLNVNFRTRNGILKAVNGLSLSVSPGEVLGIVGESGSGKSVGMYSVMGLVRDQNATIEGSARLHGKEILGLGDKQMRHIRGKDVAMIFQDPMTALTPVYTIGWQIAEQIRAHQQISRGAAMQRAVDLLAEVGIPDPKRRASNYPHEFSGGMRQRAMIAMALSCEPSVLIADEPTTALDVTIQAQILELMQTMQRDRGTAIILVSHDIGVISEVADRTVVMYAGRVVESGPTREVVRNPRHPYTWGLLGAVPRVTSNRGRLLTIPGAPPSPLNLPPGCPFAPRCVHRIDRCIEEPELRQTLDQPSHLDACWLGEDRATIRGAAEPHQEPS